MKETTYLEENARLMEFLKKVPVFDPFDRKELNSLVQMSKLKMYEDGECILQEGVADTWLYFLVQGKVRITKEGQDVAILKRRGDIFGEMGVIALAPRSASAYASGPTVCLSTDFSRMDDFDRKNKVLMGYVLYRIFSEILVSRLKQTTDELIKIKGKAGLKFW
ncbi:MAG: cyclic nucleotide-binding domain-containing protein [Desulfobacterales bacterium]